SQGVLAFQDEEDHIDFALPQDIGITDITMKDTVLVEYFNWPGPNPGWAYHIPALTVTIENFGPDTVTNFFLQGFDPLECYWCLYQFPFWFIDSISLPPGTRGVVELSPFVTHCGNELNPKICLTTIAPERKADGNYLNDQFCRSFDFILETSEQVVDKAMLVYPNPASDMIYIDIDQPILDNFICTIYDATGNVVDQFKEIEHGYSLDGYAPGIYLVMLTDQEGIVGYQRIVKANQ
ncbi:MAG TPA: T9SS type A sorting domain-containing protein, partial [Saprospiraceae bacterium]|nr:T9SS type A sorting domain-containing protein [Saprospiraceae bacterium]